MFTDNIYDTIEIEKADSNKVEVLGKWADKIAGTNILDKVIETFQAIAPIPKFHIKIKKNIPVGGGMGGGSGNAAALINFLFAEFAQDISKQEITKFSTAIGADVPVCLNSTKSYFNGAGEILSPIESMPYLYAVIIYPNMAISTQEIYEKGFQHYKDQIIHYHNFPSHTMLWQYMEKTNNDLFDNISSPIISNIIESIRFSGNCKLARMTGSGSACFGLFQTEKDMEDSARALQKKFPDYSIYITKLS